MGGRPVSPVSPEACVMSQSFGPSAKAPPASATKPKPAARAPWNLGEEEYACRELNQPGAYVSDYVIKKLQRIIVQHYRAERLLGNRDLITPQELMHPSFHSTPPIQNIFPVIVWMPGHWVFCIVMVVPITCTSLILSIAINTCKRSRSVCFICVRARRVKKGSVGR